MPRAYTRGSKLADRMEVLGFSVQELAKQTGISRFEINDYLNRRKPMTPLNVMRLCRALGCDPEIIVESR